MILFVMGWITVIEKREYLLEATPIQLPPQRGSLHGSEWGHSGTHDELQRRTEWTDDTLCLCHECCKGHDQAIINIVYKSVSESHNKSGKQSQKVIKKNGGF